MLHQNAAAKCAKNSKNGVEKEGLIVPESRFGKIGIFMFMWEVTSYYYFTALKRKLKLRKQALRPH